MLIRPLHRCRPSRRRDRPTRGDRMSACAHHAAGVGPTRPFRPLAGPTVPSLEEHLAQALFIRFIQFLKSFSEIPGNSSKIKKLIENRINIITIQSKIPWNPLEWTKFHFVHYCLIENSFESNLGVLNYKHI
jgi:hypothetical protein